MPSPPLREPNRAEKDTNQEKYRQGIRRHPACSVFLRSLHRHDVYLTRVPLSPHGGENLELLEAQGDIKEVGFVVILISAHLNRLDLEKGASPLKSILFLRRQPEPDRRPVCDTPAARPLRQAPQCPSPSDSGIKSQPALPAQRRRRTAFPCCPGCIPPGPRECRTTPGGPPESAG